MGWPRLQHQCLKGGVLGGLGKEEWGDFRTLNWEVRYLGTGVVAPLWSRTSFSCFRILSRAGPRRWGPSQEFCLVIQNSDDPSGSHQLFVYNLGGVWLLHLLKHLFTLTAWLGGDGHRQLPAGQRGNAVFCFLIPEQISYCEESKMSPHCYLPRKAVLVLFDRSRESAS